MNEYHIPKEWWFSGDRYFINSHDKIAYFNKQNHINISFQIKSKAILLINFNNGGNNTFNIYLDSSLIDSFRASSEYIHKTEIPYGLGYYSSKTIQNNEYIKYKLTIVKSTNSKLMLMIVK